MKIVRPLTFIFILQFSLSFSLLANEIISTKCSDTKQLLINLEMQYYNNQDNRQKSLILKQIKTLKQIVETVCDLNFQCNCSNEDFIPVTCYTPNGEINFSSYCIAKCNGFFV